VSGLSPQPPGGGTSGHRVGGQGLLEKLLAAVRSEFRADVLVFAPGDPVFGHGAACRIPRCGRPARPSGGSLCNNHYDRWAAGGRPALDAWVVGPEAAHPWYGHAPLPSCRVTGCRFGAMQRGLCSRHASAWRRAGRPDVASWLASAMPSANDASQRECLVNGCELWAQPAYAEGLCARHGRRWRDHGCPDLASFVRRCSAPPDDTQEADLSMLPRQLRLELQYALQCRADDRTVKVNPVVLRALVRYLATSGASSLLDRSEQEWRDDPPAVSVKLTVALLAYAHRTVTTLAEGEGWDAEYPRDTWHLRRLGTSYDTAVLDFTAISQPWLKDLAKRWTRWRITTGRARVTYGAGVRAVTRLSAFLESTRTDRAALLTRDVLERYLADLHREFAGRIVHREHVSHLGALLRDARRHQWEPALHPSAMIFPEDHPKRPRPLPRALAGHVTAQLEDPSNLGKWENPAYRLITIILMRCGLRITDAAAIPAGCVIRDAADAPYLRYYNNKMKREALVPVDDELEALVTAQEERNRQRWPQGTPVLFPRPDANIDGTRPVLGNTYRRALYRWLEYCDIRDEHGRPARLTPHQWRHTLGTWLINRDVPQHVVQKILDHDSAEMTAHYARLSDKTVRDHWEKARKVDVTGKPVQLQADGPLGDAAWAKQRLSRATQALPNGYCELPLVKTCPHANSCLTCPMFVTSTQFLPQHHAQRKATLQIISAAEAAGHARVAEMNQQVAGNLDKIIAALEADGQGEQEAAADAS
jgi:integrase